MFVLSLMKGTGVLLEFVLCLLDVPFPFSLQGFAYSCSQARLPDQPLCLPFARLSSKSLALRVSS